MVKLMRVLIIYQKNATKSNKDVWEISSNSSFVGLKGDEKLTDRLSAIYAIEWAFNADGDGDDWSKRNRFVGLKDSQLGTIKIGAHDTPVKQLSSVVDTFNNYVANKADITGIFRVKTASLMLWSMSHHQLNC